MRGRIWRALVAQALVLVLACVPASPALGQLPWVTPGEEGFDARDPSLSVGGELELTIFGGAVQVPFATADATSFSGVLNAAIVIDSVVEVGTTLGFTWGEARQSFTTDDDGAAPTNPWVYGAYVLDIERIARLRFGAGLAFPLDPRGFQDSLAALYAAGTHGLENMWLWLGNRVSIVPFATLEAMPFRYLYTAASFHLGVMVPSSSDSGVNTDVDLQFAMTGGVRAGPILGAVRLRVVWFPTDSIGEEAQVSLEPFVRVIFDLASLTGFAELGMTINLDEPLGFAFDQYKVWGIHLAGGLSY